MAAAPRSSLVIIVAGRAVETKPDGAVSMMKG